MPPRKRAAPAKKATAPQKRTSASRPTKEQIANALSVVDDHLKDEAKVPAAGQQVARDVSQDASPVQVAGPDGALAAKPVTASRDKLLDAQPAFSSPVTDRAKD